MTAFTGQLLQVEAAYRRERIAADFAQIARRQPRKPRHARLALRGARLRAARAG